MDAVSCFHEKTTTDVSSIELAAVNAWRSVHPESEQPRATEILKQAPKSAVFRLLFPNGSSIIAKRCMQQTASLEDMIYRQILSQLTVCSLKFYGICASDNSDYAWIFLEDAGDEIYLPNDAQHRFIAAQWLANMHASARSSQAAALLPERGASYYLTELQDGCSRIAAALRSPESLTYETGVLRRTLKACEVAESRWPQIEVFCRHFPKTLVHGDFVSKNLRIREGHSGLLLLALDWEHAGWAIPAADLHSDLFDAGSYWCTLRQSWPDTDERDIELLRFYGWLFRLAMGISWISYNFVRTPRSSTLATLEYYADSLEKALRRADWRI